MNDPVHHPSHYDGPPCPRCGVPVETRFLVEDMPFFRGSAVKYVLRAGRKDLARETEDLRKAIQCLEFEIERMDRSTTSESQKGPLDEISTQEGRNAHPRHRRAVRSAYSTHHR